MDANSRTRPLPRSRRRLDFGHAAGLAAEALRRDWPVLLGLTAALVWLPELIRVQPAPPRTDLALNLRNWQDLVLRLALELAIRSVFAVAVPTLMMRRLGGAANSPSWVASARAFPAVLGLALALNWAKFAQFIDTALELQGHPAGVITLLEFAPVLGVATTTLLVGGIGLLAPVQIAEGGTPFTAIARAWRLSRGGRWIMILTFWGLVLGGGVLEAVISTLGLIQFGDQALGQITGLLLFGLAPPLESLVMALFFTACYLELKQIHDGDGLGEIAEVFD